MAPLKGAPLKGAPLKGGLSQTAGQDGEARRHYERARALVEELGYGRRVAEVRELEAVIGEGVGL